MSETLVSGVSIRDYPDKIYPVKSRITDATKVVWKWGRQDCPLVVVDSRTAVINAVGDSGWSHLEREMALPAIVLFASLHGVGIVKLSDALLNESSPALALYGMPIGDYQANKHTLDKCRGIKELSERQDMMFMALIRQQSELRG